VGAIPLQSHDFDVSVDAREELEGGGGRMLVGGGEMWHVGWRRMGKVVPNFCLLFGVVLDDISSMRTCLDSIST
jgi:hypothetical protein